MNNSSPDLQALIEQLELTAKGCEVYSPDQCATLIDGIGWLATRHMLNKAADALRHTAPTLPGAGGGDDELLIAAKAYFDGYCQDEAGEDGPHWTGCSQEQHEAAKRLKSAIDAALPPQQGG